MKVIQNLKRADPQNLSADEKRVQMACQQNPRFPARVQGVSHLELVLDLKVPIVAYNALIAHLENGEQVYFHITVEHAKVLGEVLQSRDIFYLEIDLSKWQLGAFAQFLASLEAAPAKIERLALEYLTGDEFTVEDAEMVAKLASLVGCRALRVRNNEYVPNSIETLVKGLSKNSRLREISLFPHADDPAGGYAKQIQTAKNDDLLPVDEDYFDKLMRLIDHDVKSQEYFAASEAVSQVLRYLDLSPEQKGWLVKYRHQALHGVGDERACREAINFQLNPRFEYVSTFNNSSWMLSTALEMALFLKDSENAKNIFEKSLAFYSQQIESPTQLEGLLRTYCNGYQVWSKNSDMADEEWAQLCKNQILKIIAQHPNLKTQVKIPSEILDH